MVPSSENITWTEKRRQRKGELIVRKKRKNICARKKRLKNKNTKPGWTRLDGRKTSVKKTGHVLCVQIPEK